jgi:hypothetical protein
VTAALKVALQRQHAEWDLSFEVMREQFTRWWFMDEKGMTQDLGQGDGDVVLGPAWLMRAHNNSTGNRNWFTISVYMRGDGLVAPPDINLEGGKLDPRCYQNAPGHLIGCSATGMQNTASHLRSVQNFIQTQILDKGAGMTDAGFYEAGKVNGPTILGFDNASIHIQADVIVAIKERLGFGVSIPSHTTRILCMLDNGYNKEFEAGFKKYGGIQLLKSPKPTRFDLCGVIHKAHLYASAKVKDMKLGKLCGWAPFGPTEPLACLAHEGRTIENPDGAGDVQTDSLSKTATRRAEKRADSRLVESMGDLRDRLAERVLHCDALLARKTMRGVVKYEDGTVKELDPVDFAEFEKWQAKQLAKKADNAMSTQGELLTEQEFIDRLKERKRLRVEKEEKTAANKRRRTEAAEQKIIDANDRKKATEARLLAEKDIADILKLSNCWTSTSEFIINRDMKTFIKANKQHLENREGYSASLKLADALPFVQAAIDEDPSHEWVAL